MVHDDGRSAEAALQEWRAEATECALSSKSDPGLPLRDNVLTRHRLTDADEGDVVTILMRHGSLVAILVYEHPSDLPAPAARKLRRLAGLLAGRVLAKAG